MSSDTPNTAASYAQRVRAELTDLPADQLDSIMDGLDAHLAEVAADGQPDLVAALGTPEAYAADLRAAAGIVPRVVASGSRGLAWSRRHTALAVAFGVSLCGLVLAVVAPRPLSVAKVLAVVLAVGVAWWMARLVVERSGLTGTQRGVAAVALAFGALCTAVVWSAALADGESDTSLEPAPMLTTTTFLPGDYTSTMVQVANCSAQNGVARMTTQVLADAGFLTVDPTNGTCDPKLDKSIVIYNEGTPGAQTVAATLAQTLGRLPYGAATLPIPVETGVWAEGSAVVLLLGEDLAGKTLEQILDQGFGTTVPAPSWVTTTSAVGTLRFSTPLPDLDGYAEARNVGAQVCLSVNVRSGESGGCFDLALLESGNAWSAAQAAAGSPILLYGLAPSGHTFHVEVGATVVLPDANGFWYIELPQGISQFTIVIDSEAQLVPLAELSTTGTTTTVVMRP